MKIIYLLLELIPCLILGYLLGKCQKEISFQIARPLVRFGIPISITGLLLKSGIDPQLIEAAIIASLAIGVQMAILFLIHCPQDIKSNRALLLGSSFGNTGYFGIPVSIALLPQEALVYSVGFDLGATLIIWSLGPLFLSKKSEQLLGKKYFTNLWKTLISSPASKGLLMAFIIQASPWNEPITSLLWIPARVVIVLAIIVIGIQIGSSEIASYVEIKPQLKTIKNSLLIKLLGLPTIMLILTGIFNLPSMARNALVLQAAAPTAISVMLITKLYYKGDKKTTILVVFSTLIALVTIPIWSLILKA